MNLRKIQRKHFKWRIRQRYRIKISNEEIEDYVALIQENRLIQVVPVGRRSRRLSTKLLVIRGKIMPVIYDKKRKTLVTALPKACLKKFLENE
jgi:hypothetical protein